MSDTKTYLTRDEACKLADEHGWDVQDSDGPVVYAHKPGALAIIIYPTDNPWEGAPLRVLVAGRSFDGNGYSSPVELAEADVSWALTQFGSEG